MSRTDHPDSCHYDKSELACIAAWSVLMAALAGASVGSVLKTAFLPMGAKIMLAMFSAFIGAVSGGVLAAAIIKTGQCANNARVFNSALVPVEGTPVQPLLGYDASSTSEVPYLAA